MGAGTYIYPSVRGNFLSISGGTVTGDTFFTAGLTATTSIDQIAGYFSNSGYTLGGKSPILTYDGLGKTSIGYNSDTQLAGSSTGGIWYRPGIGLYIEGNPSDGFANTYGVYIPSKGGNSGLNVQNKVRIGDGQFNQGDTLEVSGTTNILGSLRTPSLSAVSLTSTTINVTSFGTIQSSGNLFINAGGVYLTSSEFSNSNLLRSPIISGTSLSASTINSSGMISTGSTRMVEANSGGTLYATKEIVDQWLYDGTNIGFLETSSNWNVYGIYTGTTITNTYRGQMHSDDNYLYIAVADNTWRRTNFV